MSTFTQDMPPKEGYRPYQIHRVSLRTIIGGRRALGLTIVATIIGHYVHFIDWKNDKRHEIEMRGALLALKPLLLAERDRAFLKQVKRNVAEEKDLMRYIPSWKVGTLYGEPIFKTIPEDQFMEPGCMDLYSHTNPDLYYKKQILRLLQ